MTACRCSHQGAFALSFATSFLFIIFFNGLKTECAAGFKLEEFFKEFVDICAFFGGRFHVLALPHLLKKMVHYKGSVPQ